MKAIQLEPETGLTIEIVKSGFLDFPVIYFLWNKNKLIAHSRDLSHWKLSRNFEKISLDKLK